jgi:hypothetical protein
MQVVTFNRSGGSGSPRMPDRTIVALDRYRALAKET